MRTKSVKWKKQVKALETYVLNKGWAVHYDPDAKNDWADWSKKTITLKPRANNEVLFYVFLHELGHMLLFQNNRSYSSKYKEVFDEFTGSTKPISLARIEEELDAWRTGLRLAKRLNLKVDRRNFEKTKSKYAMTYITWACQKFVDSNFSSLEKAINTIIEKTSLAEDTEQDIDENINSDRNQQANKPEVGQDDFGCGRSATCK